MEIKCPAFEDNGRMSARYTCDGENVHPPLLFTSVPPSVESFALIVDDMDSFAGVWNHWTIWNINSSVHELGEGIIPLGSTEGNNSFGQMGYSGPCPKKGNHRYMFKVYALDTILEVPARSGKIDLEMETARHIIEKAELVGTYSRD